MNDDSAHFDDSSELIFHSVSIRLKNCIYQAHAAFIKSNDDISEKIKRVGTIKGSSSISFAVIYFDGLNTSSYHNDNSDWGVGAILGEILENNELNNVILMVTRVLKGLSPPEIVDIYKIPKIQQVANNVISILVNYVNNKESQKMEKAKAEMDVKFEQKKVLFTKLETIKREIDFFENQLKEKEQLIEKCLINLSKLKLNKEEFERITEIITSIELQRDSIELEIEKLEDCNQNNELKLEKSNSYYNLKSELNSLRHERKKFEVGYNYYQKSSKNLEILKIEIERLKTNMDLRKTEKYANQKLHDEIII